MDHQARILQGRAIGEDSMTHALVFVGIDVSKAQLDIALRPEGRFAVPNDESGVAQLLTRLQATPSVVVVNPRQIRDFAKATGQLAKTDALSSFQIFLFKPHSS